MTVFPRGEGQAFFFWQYQYWILLIFRSLLIVWLFIYRDMYGKSVNWWNHFWQISCRKGKLVYQVRDLISDSSKDHLSKTGQNSYDSWIYARWINQIDNAHISVVIVKIKHSLISRIQEIEDDLKAGKCTEVSVNIELLCSLSLEFWKKKSNAGQTPHKPLASHNGSL